ncbi:GNAT family N-acetyltransferase [Siccirubricoccus sp. KC 17139]|uniref:L-ornithine N(alpha)-acyltransferase n=1 Tax=Siccirubricoccus soli TaxID=2899147 RepID=A0ABT1DCD0_9PROT|nr:GNAT family N-acyltransferase [Siccirubricoccus soli]MCO6418870.1 GNAT family N-acetyltransferase [Siccirubricoccus soli]MCP2685005.1 GNAT family N-acetyltransferase [Siccirubricoccus soli]
MSGTGEEAGFGELRAGHLGVRIATTPAEVDAAQALRYRVFYEEMGAQADAAAIRARRDIDEFDAVADHLLVINHERGQGPDAVVGTYRLIRRSAAARIGRFYTASEFDIGPLLALPGEILELGRSCVEADHRTRGTLQLLWRGIAAYVFRHKIDLMFGCASLHGTDLDALAPVLTYLHAHHLAPEPLRPRALPERHVEMARLDPARLDLRAVQNELPPLVKGYLRLGGFVGDGAVLDRPFNTTDICVVVKTALITDKYHKHYERRLGWAEAG